ncbi:hypothetical protein [Humisphaera borealis]|uniref:Uncharacterized protein n=1 Tax=Humisphaera borealis TaxID=2807512 RepID=A0A7M2X0D1_9BACT|nr:hypothetical protein [Humisphaera borealis]QOV90200.1 hypothetical protein IPV69_02160 [Humisphaera borealis]
MDVEPEDRRAMEVVEVAEKALAALAAEAAVARDYTRAARLLEIAQRLVALARAAGLDPGVNTSPPDLSKSGSGNGFVTANASPSTSHSTANRSKTVVEERGAVQPSDRPATSRLRGRAAGYPRFKRSGDTLVKVGWSKSDRATYEHRCPKDALELLVRRIESLATSPEFAETGRFTTDQLLPLIDAATGDEVPTYRHYMCLAWLSQVGVFEKHGRQGYTLAQSSGSLDAIVANAWEKLPTR